MNKKPLDYKNIIITAIAVVIGASVSNAVFLKMGKPTFDEKLMEVAKEFNKQLPMMIDSHTRYDAMMALPNNTLAHMYTLIHVSVDESDVNISEIETVIRAQLLNFIKTSSDMKLFRDKKVTFVYLYRDKDGKEIIKFTFDYNDYKE